MSNSCDPNYNSKYLIFRKQNEKIISTTLIISHMQISLLTVLSVVYDRKNYLALCPTTAMPFSAAYAFLYSSSQS